MPVDISDRFRGNDFGKYTEQVKQKAEELGLEEKLKAGQLDIEGIKEILDTYYSIIKKSPPTITPPPEKQQAFETAKPEKQNKYKSLVPGFKQRIQQIESGGKYYVEHPTLESGMHAGQSAKGGFAFMPKTIDELTEKYNIPGLIEKTSQERANAVKMNPYYGNVLADKLSEDLLNRSGGDEEFAAWAWEQGHNLTPEDAARRNYRQSDRARAYRELKQKGLPLQRQIQSEPAANSYIRSDEELDAAERELKRKEAMINALESTNEFPDPSLEALKRFTNQEE